MSWCLNSANCNKPNTVKGMGPFVCRLGTTGINIQGMKPPSPDLIWGWIEYEWKWERNPSTRHPFNLQSSSAYLRKFTWAVAGAIWKSGCRRAKTAKVLLSYPRPVNIFRKIEWFFVFVFRSVSQSFRQSSPDPISLVCLTKNNTGRVLAVSRPKNTTKRLKYIIAVADRIPCASTILLNLPL